MLVTIRYGDQTKAINLNCKSGVILEYIRKCGNYDSGLALDLSDKDGNVRLLRQNCPVYANSYLTPGETYFLVSAQEEAKQYVYTLLVNLKPEEPPFEVKPTKIDKKETKRPAKPPPKPPAKPKKGGK
jgi:hypothetical protein